MLKNSWRASGRDSAPAPGPRWESLNGPVDRQTTSRKARFDIES